MKLRWWWTEDYPVPEEGVPGGLLREMFAERRMRQAKWICVFMALSIPLSAVLFPSPNAASSSWSTSLYGVAVTVTSYGDLLGRWSPWIAYALPAAATAYVIHVRKYVLWRLLPLVWIACLGFLSVTLWLWILQPANRTTWPPNTLDPIAVASFFQLAVVATAVWLHWWWRKQRGYFVR